MDYYHFYQQYKDYFEILSIIKINCFSFAVIFFVAILVLDRSNASITIKILLLLYSPRLRLFFKKILGIFRLLLIIYRVDLKKIPSIS